MNALSKNYKPMVVYVNPKIEKYLKSADSDISIVKKVQYNIDQYLKFRKLNILSPLNGHNKGFLRSPLSQGSNGKTHYLWLAIGTNSFGRNKGLKENEVVFEEIRHHDLNSKKLNLGNFKKYKKYTLKNRDENDGQVWLTPNQYEAVYSESDITLIEGLPGTGKTTVLHKKSDTIKGKKQLYLTYSKKLTYEAIKSFGEINQLNNNRRALTFNDFFNELANANDLKFFNDKEINYDFSKSLFLNFLENEAKLNYSSWKDSINVLYSEIYSNAFGKLNDEYKFENSYKEFVTENFKSRKRSLDKKEYDQAEKVINKIFELGKEVELFPALYLSYHLIPKFQNKKAQLPEVFSYLDVLLIDEIQDLTELEGYLVFLYANQTKKRKNKEVVFVAAGDEAQTIRPTSFTWASFKNIVFELKKVNFETIDSSNVFEHINLDESLRSPSQISNFVYATRYFYSKIDKRERPSIKQFTGNTKDQYGRVVYYCAKNDAELKGIINKVNNLPTGISISTGISSTNDAEIKGLVSAEEVKGLDFSTVAVVDIGKTLIELEDLIEKSNTSKKYNSIIRSTIDNLMVAISRPTHTLILLDRKLDTEYSTRFNKNSNDLINKVLELYENAGITLEENTINIYKNSHDLLASLELFVDREEYIRTKLSQIQNGLLDNPLAVNDNLKLLFEEAKQQKQDGNIDEELFNELVDLTIRHTISLVSSQVLDSSKIESLNNYFKDVLEIKYPDGRFYSGETSKRSSNQKQMYDVFAEIFAYLCAEKSSFKFTLNLINKTIKNYDNLSTVLNSAILLIDKMLLDWHRSLINQNVRTIENLDQVIKVSQKLSKKLLKNDIEKIKDFNNQTYKTLVAWAESSENNKEFEISLYINKHLKKHSSVVRLYKKSLQHNKAESYISSLSPEVAKKVRKEEMLILNNIEKDLMKYLQKEKLYSEEVKHIEDILNAYRKAS